MPVTPTPSNRAKYVYWSDGNWNIETAYADGSDRRQIYAGPATGLDVDPLTEQIYWVEHPPAGFCA